MSLNSKPLDTCGVQELEILGFRQGCGLRDDPEMLRSLSRDTEPKPYTLDLRFRVQPGRLGFCGLGLGFRALNGSSVCSFCVLSLAWFVLGVGWVVFQSDLIYSIGIQCIRGEF